MKNTTSIPLIEQPETVIGPFPLNGVIRIAWTPYVPSLLIMIGILNN
jgi:hypothetical protein